MSSISCKILSRQLYKRKHWVICLCGRRQCTLWTNKNNSVLGKEGGKEGRLYIFIYFCFTFTDTHVLIQARCLAGSAENAAWIKRVSTPGELTHNKDVTHWRHTIPHMSEAMNAHVGTLGLKYSFWDPFWMPPNVSHPSDRLQGHNLGLPKMEQGSCHLHPKTNAKARKMMCVSMKCSICGCFLHSARSCFFHMLLLWAPACFLQ